MAPGKKENPWSPLWSCTHWVSNRECVGLHSSFRASAEPQLRLYCQESGRKGCSWGASIAPVLALLHLHIPKEQQQKEVLWDELLPRTGGCPKPTVSNLSHIPELQLTPRNTPGCSAPCCYLSRELCLSVSGMASSPRSSSTRGWYSRTILRKPCRKGIVLCPCTARRGPPARHRCSPAPRSPLQRAFPSFRNKQGLQQI